MREREDFVRVRLTAAGEAAAQGCGAHGGMERPKDYDGETAEPCVKVIGGASPKEGGYEFCFKPGEAQEAPRAQWDAILSKARTPDDQPLLEISDE